MTIEQNFSRVKTIMLNCIFTQNEKNRYKAKKMKLLNINLKNNSQIKKKNNEISKYNENYI